MIIFFKIERLLLFLVDFIHLKAKEVRSLGGCEKLATYADIKGVWGLTGDCEDLALCKYSTANINFQ